MLQSAYSIEIDTDVLDPTPMLSLSIQSPRSARTAHLLDDLQARVAGICTHDDCEILGEHPAHPVSTRRYRMIHPRGVLEEILYSHVLEREAKMLGQLYHDVVSDYGSVDIRSVQRTLANLVESRDVALITTRGIRHRARRIERIGGAYVRWTSPLLFDPVGMENLFDQVEDLTKGRERDHIARCFTRTVNQ